MFISIDFEWFFKTGLGKQQRVCVCGWGGDVRTRCAGLFRTGGHGQNQCKEMCILGKKLHNCAQSCSHMI